MFDELLLGESRWLGYFSDQVDYAGDAVLLLFK
jgi:hypothetical protein